MFDGGFAWYTASRLGEGRGDGFSVTSCFRAGWTYIVHATLALSEGIIGGGRSLD